MSSENLTSFFYFPETTYSCLYVEYRAGGKDTALRTSCVLHDDRGHAQSQNQLDSVF